MSDLSPAELEAFDPEVFEPEDFDDFWSGVLAEERSWDLGVRESAVDNGLAVIDCYDLTFAGSGGAPVHAWLSVPRAAGGPLPAVVEYLGYSGGRGYPFSRTLWAQAGYAHVVLDTRGQGWASGGLSETTDATAEAGLSHAPGFMTAGLTDPRTHYYRRLYVDALRLLEVVRANDRVDPTRIVLTGRSQGGGLTLAVAGLAAMSGVAVAGAAPDVPFLCHFRRAVEIGAEDPYAEIARYLGGWRDRVDAAFRTLGYLDAVNFARRASCPALFSVALMDKVCPPSTVYAAYRKYGERTPGVAKELSVYPFNDHEGGEDHHIARQLSWLTERF